MAVVGILLMLWFSPSHVHVDLASPSAPVPLSTGSLTLDGTPQDVLVAAPETASFTGAPPLPTCSSLQALGGLRAARV